MWLIINYQLSRDQSACYCSRWPQRWCVWKANKVPAASGPISFQDSQQGLWFYCDLCPMQYPDTHLQWRIQDLRLRGGPTFLEIELHPPPPLERFSWSHYKSLYLDFLGFRIAPPLCFFPEGTIKVYSWIFFWIHYKSLYIHFFGDFQLHPPPPCAFSLKPL